MAKRKKGNVVKVDFSDVEDGFKVINDGEYNIEVTKVESKEGDEFDYFAWTFALDGGVGRAYYNTSLNPNSLWNLRNVLNALGIEVPKSTLKINLGELVGLSCVGLVEAEVYDGKKKNIITDFINGETESGSDDDDAEELNPDDILEMSEDDLEEVIEEFDLDVDLDDFKSIKKKRKAVLEALEEEGDDDDSDEDDDEDEDDDKSDKSESDDDDTYDLDEIMTMGTKDLDTVIADAELSKKMKKLKPVKKKRRAVRDALREEDLLDE